MMEWHMTGNTSIAEELESKVKADDIAEVFP